MLCADASIDHQLWEIALNNGANVDGDALRSLEMLSGLVGMSAPQMTESQDSRARVCPPGRNLPQRMTRPSQKSIAKRPTASRLLVAGTRGRGVSDRARPRNETSANGKGHGNRIRTAKLQRGHSHGVKPNYGPAILLECRFWDSCKFAIPLLNAVILNRKVEVAYYSAPGGWWSSPSMKLKLNLRIRPRGSSASRVMVMNRWWKSKRDGHERRCGTRRWISGSGVGQ